MRKLLIFIPIFLVIVASLTFSYKLFGPPGNSKDRVVFIVPQNKEGFDLAQSLFDQKLISNVKAFSLLSNVFFTHKEVRSGGHEINQTMNAWQVLKKVTGNPDLVWVTISFCPRKEQVGEKLASALGWTDEEINQWNTVYSDTKPEYFEGVYYPDTYLIPINESVELVAERLISRFNEKFAPLADKFVEKNIKWTTGLKIASLIAREAGGVDDMKLISGVIWNRLDEGMRLQIDATMQYTLGKTMDGSWWGNISLDQKQSDSPYNSYLYKGLPPTPICSPNIDAIEAALNPDETDCLFYLHDTNKQIHCAVTYEEHLSNIKKYLVN